MQKVNLENIVWKEGKYFVSQCLNVDVSSFGMTRQEALENLNEALGLYFDDGEVPQVAEVKEPRIVGLPFSYA